MKLKVRSEYSDKTSCFELKLFSSAPRNYFVRFTRTFKVSGRSVEPISLRQ
eukprot:UN04731